MNASERLRLRFLSVISSGALIAPLGACNNSSSGPSGARPMPATGQKPSNEKPPPVSRDAPHSILPTKAMCPDGPGEVRCFDPGLTHFNPGDVPSDQPPPPNPPAEFDTHRCQVRAQVQDGCCNPAVTGPSFENGQCCYGFCTGLCCGRPLFVASKARVASIVKRDDWLESPRSARGERLLD